jgi:hypothetical protein
MNKLVITMLLFLVTLPTRASDMVGAFGQGSAQFSLLAGSGSAFNNDYFIIGAGLEYFVRDGVGVGLSYENWSGNGPTLNQTSPSVQYVFYQNYQFQPYIGAFYRHTAVANSPSINSVGGRAGFYFDTGPRSIIGVGLAYESYLNCQNTVFASCTETYPEISVIFGF